MLIRHDFVSTGVCPVAAHPRVPSDPGSARQRGLSNKLCLAVSALMSLLCSGAQAAPHSPDVLPLAAEQTDGHSACLGKDGTRTGNEAAAKCQAGTHWLFWNPGGAGRGEAGRREGTVEGLTLG